MSIFKKQYTKELPAEAEIITSKGINYAKWTDRHGNTHKYRIVITAQGKQRIKCESNTYYIRYRDENGIQREKNTGCRHKDAAKAYLQRITRQVELVKSGVITPDEISAANHLSLPIQDSLEPYYSQLSLISKKQHLKDARANIARIVTECDIKVLADISTEKITNWLVLQKEQNMGARTRNLYRAKIHAKHNNIIVDFGSFTDKTPFEKVHLSFCKYILGVRKRSSNLASRWNWGDCL